MMARRTEQWGRPDAVFFDASLCSNKDKIQQNVAVKINHKPLLAMKPTPLSITALMVVLLAGPGAGLAHSWALPWMPTDEVEGTWLGTLQTPGVELRIVFHITRDSTGALAATLDSPDQGATGIPAGPVTVTGDSLRIEVPAVGGFYEGTLSEDGDTIDGRWSQGGASLPLVLKRTEEEIEEPARPQEPQPPYPYDVEDVTYDNAEADVTLAGTLTTPRGDGPFAAAVLISGSGPQNRDEELMGHKPFHVLADYLTRQGIAVLRYDDRGIAESTGNFRAATSVDFAGDALAGVAYLKSRPKIDPAKIGLVGHSEGGLIAPIAAVKSSDVGFIVLMAGPGMTGEQILYLQGALIMRANGAPEATITQNREQQEFLFTTLLSEPDSAAADQKLRTAIQERIDAMTDEERQTAGLTDDNVQSIIDGQIRRINNPWFRYFLAYDPVPTLREVTCPVLAINGELDLQVPPKENLQAIEEAVREGGNDAVTIVELEGLNHLFQTAQTGSPNEYSTIEETFSPTALAVIGDWILKLGEE